MQYSWDDCSSVVTSRSFTTPAVYTQAVSVLGLDQPIESLRLIIKISGGFSYSPDAWRFSDLCQNPPAYYCIPYAPLCCPWGAGACQPFGRVSTLLAESACDTIPGLRVSAHYEDQGPTAFCLFVVVDGTADGSFTPDPTQRYTLIRMAFDHASSVTGDSGEGSCGHAEWPLRFEIGDLYLNGVDQRGRVNWDSCVLAWNGYAPGPGSEDCPLVVPANNRTWGQIKTIYR